MGPILPNALHGLGERRTWQDRVPGAACVFSHLSQALAAETGVTPGWGLPRDYAAGSVERHEPALPRAIAGALT